MKFVALTLALLLAVGSQAAPLQADSLSQLELQHSVMNLYLAQVKDSAKKALDQLDDIEYKALKASMSGRLDEMHAQIKDLRSAVPVSDSAFNAVADANADFRASVINDINAVKAELEPKRAALKEVLDQNFAEYRLELEPIVKEYAEKSWANMEAMKAKLEPIMENIRAKVAVNMEENKAALMSPAESVRAKLAERLESLKQIVSPFVEEYKEQLKQAQSINPAEAKALMSEDLKMQASSIFHAVAALFNKQ